MSRLTQGFAAFAFYFWHANIDQLLRNTTPICKELSSKPPSYVIVNCKRLRNHSIIINNKVILGYFTSSSASYHFGTEFGGHCVLEASG
jgi:hypothetical protein